MNDNLRAIVISIASTLGLAICGAFLLEYLTGEGVADQTDLAIAIVGFLVFVVSGAHVWAASAHAEALNSVKSALSALEQTVGVRVMYIAAGDAKPDGSGLYTTTDVYAEASRRVLEAERSIDVLNSFVSSSSDPSAPRQQDPVDAKALEEFFTAIQTTVERNFRIRYRRVVQTENEDNTLSRGKTEASLNHFEWMVQPRGEGTNGVLSVSDPFHPESFVLVDERTLLWMVEGRDLAGRLKPSGFLIVDDPERRVVAHFKDHFDQAWGEGQPVDVDTVLSWKNPAQA